MAEFDALPIWTDKYLADCGHLSTIEHGAYFLLLMTAWRTKDGLLPDDDKLLARYARLTAKQWARIRPVLEPLYVVRNGVWENEKLTRVRIAVRRQVQQRSNAGKASALKRNETRSTGVGTKSQQQNQNQKQSKESSEAKASSPKKGSRLPDDWLPSETDTGYAREQGLTDEQIQRTAQDFADYWHAASGQRACKQCWAAAWRSWVRKAADDYRRLNGRAPAARQERRGPVGIAETVAWLDARDSDA